jgi:type IV secretion system protein VirB8
MSPDPTVKAYFAEAIAWDADRVAMKERSVRVAWRVAAFSSLVTVLAIAALLVLMPLKRVDPYLIRVDSSTGLVDVVPVFSGDTPLPETVTRYFLDHYVTTCERFNFSTAESDYEECGAFHNPQRNQAWFAAWAKTNPNSPLNLYKDGTTVRAQVTSVSFFTRADGVGDLAQVRYVKAKRQSGTAEEERTHWIATLRFAYAKPALDAATRRWNPLGFKVLDFRPEPEVLSEAQAPGKHP